MKTITVLVALLVACVNSQAPEYAPAPAPEPAPAVGAFPVVSFPSQLQADPVLASAYCTKRLDLAYDVYTATGNWSMVPDFSAGTYDSTHHLFCFSVNPVGQSTNETYSVVEVGVPVGRTAAQAIQAGVPGFAKNATTGTIDAVEGIIAAVRAVENRDRALFSAPNLNLQNADGTSATGKVLGMAIWGKNPQERDITFYCACLYNVVPNPAPATSSSG